MMITCVWRRLFVVPSSSLLTFAAYSLSYIVTVYYHSLSNGNMAIEIARAKESISTLKKTIEVQNQGALAATNLPV